MAEVLIAGTVFVLAASGLFTILLKSYRLAALARYRDDARAVLRTFADQFQRLATADDLNYRRELFITSNSTGKGLLWWDVTQAPTGKPYGLSNESCNATPFANEASSLQVTLGGIDNPIQAQVTRTVQAVNPGLPASSVLSPVVGDVFAVPMDPNYAAGNLWQATFTITYTVNQTVQTQSITILRAAP